MFRFMALTVILMLSSWTTFARPLVKDAPELLAFTAQLTYLRSDLQGRADSFKEIKDFQAWLTAFKRLPTEKLGASDKKLLADFHIEEDILSMSRNDDLYHLQYIMSQPTTSLNIALLILTDEQSWMSTNVMDSIVRSHSFKEIPVFLFPSLMQKGARFEKNKILVTGLQSLTANADKTEEADLDALEILDEKKNEKLDGNVKKFLQVIEVLIHGKRKDAVEFLLRDDFVKAFEIGSLRSIIASSKFNLAGEKTFAQYKLNELAVNFWATAFASMEDKLSPSDIDFLKENIEAKKLGILF